MADAMPQLAQVSDRPLGADLAHPRSEGVPAAPSRWRLGGQALLLALAYYAGAQIGFALQSPTEPHSVLWLPNSILLSVLLVTPPRQWPVYLLAVFTAGAYGFAMASNYNARPRAPEVLVDGDSYKVIRRRETYEDLVAAEMV